LRRKAGFILQTRHQSFLLFATWAKMVNNILYIFNDKNILTYF
jgi:hypothetical protein